MKATPIYGFPYAEDSDAPNYPLQGKELAEAIEKAELLTASLKDAAVTDAKLASPNNAAYRHLFRSQTYLPAETPAGTYFLSPWTASLSNVLSGANTTGQFIPIFRFSSADYAVPGKTLQMQLRVQVATRIKQTVTFTFGIYQTTVGGEAGQLVRTLSKLMEGSTVAVTNAEANSTTMGHSAFPAVGDNNYALGVVVSGKLPAGEAHLYAQLELAAV